ncbi:leucine-rich repeat protein [Desulfitobacterium sp. Sab5]|uniref:leucine-rich repeat protein n=1 Tax=Desulfitobacterium nosdiversum TaxID=3375356 RepID=UPI003CF2D183
MKTKIVFTLLIILVMLLQPTLVLANSSLRLQDNRVIIDTSISLNKTSDVLKIGETEILVPEIMAPMQFAVWSSSNDSIATVNMKGKITGVSQGTARITVKSMYDFKTATCTITVKDDNSDIVKFKDKNLELIVRHAINKPKGEIYKSDVKNITKLAPPFVKTDPFSGEVLPADIDGFSGEDPIGKITELNGIEYLTNLSYLSLPHNEIRDLGPLKGLKNIECLALDNNRISDISELHGLTNLKQLSLYNNEIDDINPLEGLQYLSYLDLGYNKIKNINYYQIRSICVFEGNDHMSHMYLDHNEINDTDIKEIEHNFGVEF